MPQKRINRRNGGRDTWCRSWPSCVMCGLSAACGGLLTLLLASLVLLLCTACALLRGRRPRCPPQDRCRRSGASPSLVTPQFSSKTLLGEMVTKPRPFLQFCQSAASPIIPLPYKRICYALKLFRSWLSGD